MSRPPTDSEPRLYDCALTLFAAKGYAATSVREIIEAVGLSKPVLYYYCKNKLDLFEKLVHRIQSRAYEALERQTEGEKTATEKLRKVIRGTFAFCAADWRIPRLMFAASYGPEIPEIETLMKSYGDKRYGLVRTLIVEGLGSDEFHEADPDMLTLAFCSAMDHPANVLTRDAALASHLTPELADSLFALFLEGARKR